MTGLALAISASARAFSIAVRDAEGAVRMVCPEEATASDLAVTVEQLFTEHGATPTDLREIRLDVGPGSYTGLRVALTFARFAAAFHGVPVHVGTSLELLALAAHEAGSLPAACRARVVLDARRERFHHAPLACTSMAIELEAEPRATSRDELLDVLGGDEIILAEPALHAMFTDRTVIAPPPPHAAHLFDQRLSLRSTAPEALEPLYLMGSYAES